MPKAVPGYKHHGIIQANKNTTTQMKSLEKNKTTKSFYLHLKPNFTETGNWITSHEEVDQFATLMDTFVLEMK